MPLTVLAFQNIPPAPGHDSTGTAQPVPAPHEKEAPGAAGTGGPSQFLLLLVMVAPMLLFLFWSSRSQQKKQTAALSAIKKGDRVLTQSGLVGKLVEMGERSAKVEIAPGVKVEILKSGILGVDTAGDAPAAADKPAADKAADKK